MGSTHPTCWLSMSTAPNWTSSSRLWPRAVVVEHHAVPGDSDYNPGRVVSAVEEAGYQIVAVHMRKTPPRFGGQETVLIGRMADE